MERGREGRRGGGGGGLVHAPRRPRTGFKDAAVGDDADGMMDDMHNSRLRERAKKDGGGVSGSGVHPSIVMPSSRNKRKRQGSQEIQVHARNSPVNDVVEETTEDTEMGVSEDDDDTPPPIIARRPGKPRPQAKFAEDGVAVDLPQVPRKARTAMGKRHLEPAAASVPESPVHGGAAVAVSTPPPSSTPSSSSMASLKPGRRTKPSGSKPRGHKLAKVSTPSSVSEQEVEVAEALFDLARMFTQPPPSESKTEAKASVNEARLEAKQETKVGRPQAPNGPNTFPSASSAGGASGVAGVGGSMRGSSPGEASAASPAPSPSAPGPIADGVRRKRPRMGTRTEEGAAVAHSRTAPSTASAAVPQAGNREQSTSVAADTSAVKVEGSGTAVVASVTNVTRTPTSPANVGGGASIGMGAPTVGAAAAPSITPGEKNGVDKVFLEKKAVQISKTEGANSNFGDKRVADHPVKEKKTVSGDGAAVANANKVSADVKVSASTGAGPVTTTKTEVDKRLASDVEHVPKREIDLMAGPSKAGTAEKDGETGDADVQDASEKRAVDAAVEMEREREEKEKVRVELEWGREREQRREAESAREAVKERETERELKAGIALQRSGKNAKAENGRAQKGVERAGRAGSPLVASVGAAGAPGNVAAVPMSVGMLNLPAGMAAGGLGYFPAAAAATAAAEESTPAVQVAPFVMGGRAQWKRCAQHVYIARFIDMQQQLGRNQSFFTGGIGAYPKSYNLNVAVGPSESSAFGGAAGAVGGPAAGSGPTGASGTGAANPEATERGLNAAAMAAAAAGMQGVKDRTPFSLDMGSRKSPGQHQGSAQGPPTLSLQTGGMFGIPNTQSSASPSGGASSGVGGAGPGGGGGAMGGPNLNLPPAAGPAGGGGSSSALVLGPGGAVGAMAPGGISGAAASAAMQAQYMQAMMQQAQQSGSFPFPQFAPHFGPAAFGGSAPHLGSQQMAQLYAAAGGPYFNQLMVHPQQQQAGQQQSGSAAGARTGAKVQQGQQQQGGSRSFGGGVTAPPQSPSHSAMQGGGSHVVGRAGDREGLMVGGENGSSGESKLGPPVMSGGGPNAVTMQHSASGGAGAAEYNLMGALGKQQQPKSREQQQGQGEHQQQQVQGEHQQQHHYPGSHHGGKGMEGASSQGFPASMSMAAAMNTRGPGPLGLAPVAAVMAPQGHAMIQSITESGGRGHPQGGGGGHPQMVGNPGHSSMMQQQHQQWMQMQQAQHQIAQAQAQAQAQQSQQQQQHHHQQSVQAAQQLHQQHRGMQNARIISEGEDSRSGADGSYATGRGREREVVEERKLQQQGRRVTSSGGSSPLSREVEGGGGGGMQSSAAAGGGGMGGGSRSVGTTLNLMAPTNAGMGGRASGGQAVSGVGPPVQAGPKAGSGRVKGSGTPGPAPGGPPPGNGGAAPAVVSHGSFAERAGGGAVAAASGKSSPTGGLSLGGGQNMMGAQSGGRQAQGVGAKAIQSQRPALVSGATATPTAPGTNLQAVLAAAMAKNPQTQQQQQSQRPASASAPAGVNANAAPSSRMGTSVAQGPPPASSGGAPALAPMAPPTKNPGANPAKSGSSGKAPSFPASGGKAGGGGGGKLASSPSSSVGHAPSILGPSPLAQNNPQQQPQLQQMQGQSQHGQLGPPQLLQQQQFQQQQHHHQMMRQQQQMMQQQMFQQHHQMQQASHMQVSHSGGPTHGQSPQQSFHQQQSVHQQQQQQPGSAGQAQQGLSNLQNQQQHVQQQQASHPQQQQQFGVPAGNGSLAFGSGVSMGRNSNNPGESGGQSALNVRPLHSVKPPGSSSSSNPNSSNGGGTQQRPGSGPAFLQQFGPQSVAVSSSGQGSPAYSQTQGNANPGARAGNDGKSFLDAGQDHVRMAQARGGATPAGSPGVQGSSQRPQGGGGGGGSAPGPGPGPGPSKAAVQQFNGFGDVGQQLRTSMMMSNSAVSGGGGGSGSGAQQMSSSGTSVQSVGNGRPAFSSGPASSLTMTGSAVVPTGGPAAAAVLSSHQRLFFTSIDADKY